MKNIKKIVSITIVFLLILTGSSLAHSGRTDSSGGHRDNKNKSGLGSYHYHHGYGPHHHPNGVCPYLTLAKPKATTSTSIKKTSQVSSQVSTTSKKIGEVDITLPNFKIIINGNSIDNTKSKYPFILYKNITYMPMTWSLCNHLGIKIQYSEKDGLVLRKSESKYSFDNELIANENSSKLGTAKKAKHRISLNGKVIDNSKEEYPILQFRNITYFPLTWNYVVNEFDLNILFDKQNGLVIKY